ncbi:MAG: hypothetical protein IT238_12445 [Bacteroidia bacterium]|nr:hypothetical protein [Bacteroidia bacterium]
MKQVTICFIYLFFLCLVVGNTNAFAQLKTTNGFTHRGDFFDDKDWGTLYKTTEEDRRIFSRIDKIIHESIVELLKSIEEQYEASIVHDLSSVFDSAKQQKALKNGVKCVTCVGSDINFDLHFSYHVITRLDMIEESEEYKKNALRGDSLFKVESNSIIYQDKTVSESQVNAEMEKLEKEIAAIDLSKATEEQIAEIERKGKRIEQLSSQSTNIKGEISKDSLHALRGLSYAERMDISISTNQPLYVAKRNTLISLKNKKDRFVFKELTIPGCAFTCIYFDKYNDLIDELGGQTSHPVFLAYIGNIYPNKESTPRAYLDPFCVTVTFKGNLEQIESIYKQIDYVKLSKIIN